MNVRFDGVYQEISEANGKHYIRFYKNGNVIDGSTTENPVEAAEWLQKANIGNGYVSIAKYNLIGNQISFTTKDEDGEVRYNGIINSEKLELNFFSSINGAKGKDDYKFIKIENLVDRSNEPLPDRTGKILNYNGEWEEQFIRFDKLEDDEAIKKYPLDKFGEMILIYQKSDTKLIEQLDKNWAKLETEVAKSLEEMVINSERLGHLKVKYFQATGSTTYKEIDQFTTTNVLISFHLLSTPEYWDIFILEDKIFHYQPVF